MKELAHGLLYLRVGVHGLHNHKTGQRRSKNRILTHMYMVHSHQKSVYIKQSRFDFRLFEPFFIIPELFGPARMGVSDFNP